MYAIQRPVEDRYSSQFDEGPEHRVYGEINRVKVTSGGARVWVLWPDGITTVPIDVLHLDTEVISSFK